MSALLRNSVKPRLLQTASKRFSSTSASNGNPDQVQELAGTLNRYLRNKMEPHHMPPVQGASHEAFHHMTPHHYNHYYNYRRSHRPSLFRFLFFAGLTVWGVHWVGHRIDNYHRTKAINYPSQMEPDYRPYSPPAPEQLSQRFAQNSNDKQQEEKRRFWRSHWHNSSRDATSAPEKMV